MKQYSKKLFSIAMLLSTAAVTATSVAPYLQFRSQGRNNARKIVGETSYHTDLYDMDDFYGTFDATLEYDRSFRPQYITDAIFGSDALKLSTTTVTPTPNNCSAGCSNKNGRSIVVSGSALTNRTVATDWMAENFLLPTNFQSIMTFKPLVQNVLVNFDWYMGLDKWAKGLYFRLYGPVVNNRTSLKFSENIVTPGSNNEDADTFNYTPGYFSENGVPLSELFTSAGQFFSGATNTKIPTITFDPLMFAKFQTCGHKSKTGFAELRGELGWNYLKENYRVGFNIQAAAPTGTRPKAEYVLEPEIGNGKHWELGVGLKSLWTMWRSEDEEKHFDFIIEADITHLFKAKQTRTFDLIGKPNSRYMLAEKLAPIGTTVPALDAATDTLQVQFAQEYSPVANLSTQRIKSSFSVQGDVVAMFTYTMRGFTWDLGYNFWGLGTEKISLSGSNNSNSSSSNNNNNGSNNNTMLIPANTWALKGDAQVAGFVTVGGVVENVYLAATETGASNNTPGATIHAGTNNLFLADGFIDNTNVDNAVDAVANVGGTPPATQDVLSYLFDGATPPANPQIATSNPPVFITMASLDIDGARMRGYSNKVFTHFGYSWNDRERWVPYVGVGASAEFGSHSSNNNNSGSSNNNVVNNNNSSSSNSGGSSTSFALSQWALWVKGGISFH